MGDRNPPPSGNMASRVKAWRKVKAIRVKILYIDVLFLINFCLDYMALHLTGGLLHRERRVGRLLLASLLGALYATITVLYQGNDAVSFAISVIFSFLMVFFVYGGASCRHFFKTAIVFYGVSLLLGAIVTVAYSTLNRSLSMDVVAEDFSERRLGLFFLLAGMAGLLLRWAGIWLSKSASGDTECAVKACLFGKEVSFRALLDSGNLLTDPLSGRRVVVVGESAVRAALPKELLRMLATDPPDPARLPYAVARRIRLIPVGSIGGRRLLVGVVPDQLILHAGNGGEKKIDAILAIDTEGRTDYGGCQGIMPMSLAA